MESCRCGGGSKHRCLASTSSTCLQCFLDSTLLVLEGLSRCLCGHTWLSLCDLKTSALCYNSLVPQVHPGPMEMPTLPPSSKWFFLFPGCFCLLFLHTATPSYPGESSSRVSSSTWFPSPFRLWSLEPLGVFHQEPAVSWLCILQCVAKGLALVDGA